MLFVLPFFVFVLLSGGSRLTGSLLTGSYN